MSKQETFNISTLTLLDSQNKIKDRIKKGVVIHVGDEHYAQATQILDKHRISYGNVRNNDLLAKAIQIH